MSIQSRILLSEAVDNTERKFGSANRYYPVYVRVAGQWQPALFTRAQLDEARTRAIDNPEDMPPRAGTWSRLADGLRRALGIR